MVCFSYLFVVLLSLSKHMNVNFGSLNINGGTSLERKVQVKDLTRRLHLDVLLLQETHGDLTAQAQWRRLMKGQWFFSDINSFTAGIAFFVSPSLTLSQVHYNEIIPGRLACLQFIANNQIFTFLNIYAPNENAEKYNFFLKLEAFLSTIDLNCCFIMSGDFNCTLDPALDRNSVEPHPKSAKTLEKIIKTVGLVDVWRIQHPRQCQFTWFKMCVPETQFMSMLQCLIRY